MKLSLQWKWFFGLVVLIAGLLLVSSIGVGFALPPFLEQTIRHSLEREAHLATQVFLPKLAVPAHDDEINGLAHALAAHTGLRISVIAADGKVIGESDKPTDHLGTVENHLQRPEVQQAIHHGIGTHKRHSATVNADLLYVAVAAKDGDRLAGIVRVALPLHQIAATIAHVRRIIASASIAVWLVAVPLLFWMSRRVTKPIQSMSEAAAQIARGNFPHTIRTNASGELRELAGALNDMSVQLQKRLRELSEEKTELAAILASMSEGVLVVDAGGRIRMMNDALRRQLQLGAETIGRTVLEALRNVTVQELTSAARLEGRVSAVEVTLGSPNERIFDVDAACLRGRDGQHEGTVVVFHDITRIKQLENVRKEFVANVSHELRTPLSIIKGYIETLLDDQPPPADEARNFLQTIQRHARRLETLIDDLLTISALESQQTRLDLAAVSPRLLANAVIEELSAQANTKSISVRVSIPDSIPLVRADPQRLHQVFFNLLDNAVKYIQPGGEVVISARQQDDEVEFCVADNGPGMAPEHLPRIFERFYRADKARSRELGGTGLGLSIVKHIVLAHGGRVWAESKPAMGSRFYFTVPRAK